MDDDGNWPHPPDWTGTWEPGASWVPGGDGEPEPPGLSLWKSGPRWVTSSYLEGGQYGRYRVPRLLGNYSSSDQSGSSLFSPWHLSNLLHPHLSVCSGAASPGHSLIKSECPECPWRRGGGGLRGWREKRETGSWGKNHEGGGEAQTFRERPFVLLSWQLMLGSDILRGSGDSFGDIPVCDSMTNLCLYLILESVETARRTAVWGCRAPVCRRVGSFPLCPASALKHQDQCPGGRGAHVKAETALLPSQGLIIRSPVNSTM